MTLLKIRKILLFLPILVPIIFTPFTYQPWIFGKTILVFMAIELAMVLFIVNVYRQQEKANFYYNKIDLVVLFLFFVSLVAVFFAEDSERALFGSIPRMLGVVTYTHLLVYYFLLKKTWHPSDWSKVWLLVMVVGWSSIFLAWVGPKIKIFDLVIPGDYQRLNGMVGNPIYFASYLFLLVAMMALAIFTDHKFQKYYAATIILAIVTIFATGTRGAVLAIFGALVFFFLAIVLFLKGRKKLKISVLALFVFLSGIIGLFYTQSQLLNQAPYAIRQAFNISTSGLGSETRLMAWQIAWDSFLQRPILGWGPSNFIFAMDKNYNPKFLTYGFGETVWDIPHNSLLEVLVSIGALGFLAFVFLIFWLIKNIFIFYKQKENSQKYLWLFLASIFGYFLQGLFTSEGSNTLFYLAILLAFFQYSNNNQRHCDWKYNKIIFYILGVFALGALYWSYQSISMANHLIKADDAAAYAQAREWQYEAMSTMNYDTGWQTEQAVQLVVQIQNFSSVHRQGVDFNNINNKLNEIFDKKNTVVGSNYWYNYWQAQLYGNMGEMIDPKYFDNAIAKLAEAEKFALQRQQLPMLKARYLLAQNKIDEAKQVLVELINKNDQFSQPHWFYGLSLVMDKDIISGVKELERAVELGFSLDKEANIEYMISLYAELKQYEKIIPLMESLIGMQPSNALLYARLALVYAELGGHEDLVIENLNQAVSIDPELQADANSILKQFNINQIK